LRAIVVRLPRPAHPGARSFVRPGATRPCRRHGPHRREHGKRSQNSHEGADSEPVAFADSGVKAECRSGFPLGRECRMSARLQLEPPSEF
jgi:hypothetical protein